MPIPTYTPGYPPDGASLGQTKVTIRNNLDGTFDTLGVNHVNNNGQPGSQPAGYHTIVQEVTQTSISTLSGYNQVFSGVPGTLSVNSTTTANIPPTSDTQLYSLSGTGVLSQLTGHVASSNGYQWIGGVLLQWGNGTATIGGNTIDFPIKFPNNVFSVVISAYNTGTPARTVSISGGASLTSFNAISNININTSISFIAIGN